MCKTKFHSTKCDSIADLTNGTAYEDNLCFLIEEVKKRKGKHRTNMQVQVQLTALQMQHKKQLQSMEDQIRVIGG